MDPASPGIPFDYKLDDYMIVFKETPPDYVTGWLNQNNIPWTTYEEI